MFRWHLEPTQARFILRALGAKVGIRHNRAGHSCCMERVSGA